MSGWVCRKEDELKRPRRYMPVKTSSKMMGRPVQAWESGGGVEEPKMWEL
jgi:hypothetical protein